MPGFDVDATLQLQLGAFGVVGVVTAARFIVSYLKRLFNLHGRLVMVLTLAVSMYTVLTAFLATQYPALSMIFSIVYIGIVVAATADAFQKQEESSIEEREDRNTGNPPERI